MSLTTTILPRAILHAFSAEWTCPFCGAVKRQGFHVAFGLPEQKALAGSSTLRLDTACLACYQPVALAIEATITTRAMDPAEANVLLPPPAPAPVPSDEETEEPTEDSECAESTIPVPPPTTAVLSLESQSTATPKNPKRPSKTKTKA